MTSTIFDVIWIASPIRIACNVSIISRLFLEVTGGAVTSLFLALSVVLRLKIIIPYARYIVNKILCKCWKSFYGQFLVSKGYSILTDMQEKGTISQVLTAEILIFVLIRRKAREIIVNWFTLLIDLLRYFWHFLMRWLDIKRDKWYNDYVDWYYGHLIASNAILMSCCIQ